MKSDIILMVLLCIIIEALTCYLQIPKLLGKIVSTYRTLSKANIDNSVP